MARDKLFIVDPFNDEHINKFLEFEKENATDTKTSSYLNDIRKNYTKENYQNNLKNNNIINQGVFLEDKEKIKDYCFVTLEKDRKIATLHFPELEHKIKNRTILPILVEYVFSILKAEEIFTTVSSNNKSFITTLIKEGFESLGEENNKEIFIKQKEYEKQIGKVI